MQWTLMGGNKHGEERDEDMSVDEREKHAQV